MRRCAYVHMYEHAHMSALMHRYVSFPTLNYLVRRYIFINFLSVSETVTNLTKQCHIFSLYSMSCCSPSVDELPSEMDSKTASAANIPLFMALCKPLILATFMKPGLQPIRQPPGNVSLGMHWKKHYIVTAKIKELMSIHSMKPALNLDIARNSPILVPHDSSCNMTHHVT